MNKLKINPSVDFSKRTDASMEYQAVTANSITLNHVINLLHMVLALVDAMKGQNAVNFTLECVEIH
jgi:hypothetical protein